MFEITAINPELVRSIEQVYRLRRIAVQFFCHQNWQQLIVENDAERSRSIVAFVDVLKRADQLNRVLILSIETNVLNHIQRSFHLHTLYTTCNLWSEQQTDIHTDISFVSYEQFFELFGLSDLDKIFDQFQLIILDDADNEKNEIFIRKLRNYQHWVLKIFMPKPEILSIA